MGAGVLMVKQYQLEQAGIDRMIRQRLYNQASDAGRAVSGKERGEGVVGGPAVQFDAVTEQAHTLPQALVHVAVFYENGCDDGLCDDTKYAKHHQDDHHNDGEDQKPCVEGRVLCFGLGIPKELNITILTLVWTISQIMSSSRESPRAPSRNFTQLLSKQLRKQMDSTKKMQRILQKWCLSNMMTSSQASTNRDMNRQTLRSVEELSRLLDSQAKITDSPILRLRWLSPNWLPARESDRFSVILRGGSLNWAETRRWSLDISWYSSSSSLLRDGFFSIRISCSVSVYCSRRVDSASTRVLIQSRSMMVLLLPTRVCSQSSWAMSRSNWGKPAFLRAMLSMSWLSSGSASSESSQQPFRLNSPKMRWQFVIVEPPDKLQPASRHNIHYLNMFRGLTGQYNDADSCWKAMGFAYKFYFISTLAIFLVSLVLIPICLLFVNAPILTVFGFQIWRLFFCFWGNFSSMFAILNILFSFLWLIRLLQDAGKSTVFALMEAFLMSLTIQIALTVLYVITYLIGFKADMIGYGWFPIILVYEFQYAAINPEERRQFCCFPFLVKNKHFPWIIMAFLCILSNEFYCFLCAGLIGYVEASVIKKSLIRLPLGFYYKLEACLPNSIKKRPDFVSVYNVQEFIASHSLSCGSILPPARNQNQNQNPYERNQNNNDAQQPKQISKVAASGGVKLGGSGNEVSYKDTWKMRDKQMNDEARNNEANAHDAHDSYEIEPQEPYQHAQGKDSYATLHEQSVTESRTLGKEQQKKDSDDLL